MSEKKNARLVDWRLTVAVWVVGSVLFGTMFGSIRLGTLSSTNPKQVPSPQQTQPPQATPQQSKNPLRKQRAFKSLKNVETLALYIAGTKTGEQCAVPAVQMTRAFVQASLDAGDWKGLPQLRKVYENSCSSICEQPTKTACYVAIIGRLAQWKEWLSSQELARK